MSMLKRSVLAGLVLLALISVSHAACWHEIIKPGATHCQDGVDKTWHAVGSQWKNSMCAKCWCSADSLSCCHGWPTSVAKECIIKHDYKTCTYEIINIEHPGHQCPSAIGK